MSKLYYEALSKIPKRFIDEATRCTEYEIGIMVLIANPKHAPMIYRAKTGKWGYLRLKMAPPKYSRKLVLRNERGLNVT